MSLLLPVISLKGWCEPKSTLTATQGAPLALLVCSFLVFLNPQLGYILLRLPRLRYQWDQDPEQRRQEKTWWQILQITGYCSIAQIFYPGGLWSTGNSCLVSLMKNPNFLPLNPPNSCSEWENIMLQLSGSQCESQLKGIWEILTPL